MDLYIRDSLLSRPQQGLLSHYQQGLLPPLLPPLLLALNKALFLTAMRADHQGMDGSVKQYHSPRTGGDSSKRRTGSPPEMFSPANAGQMEQWGAWEPPKGPDGKVGAWTHGVHGRHQKGRMGRWVHGHMGCMGCMGDAKRAGWKGGCMDTWGALQTVVLACSQVMKCEMKSAESQLLVTWLPSNAWPAYRPALMPG